jgi:selenocysteine lyase/cysteine desulfurase
MSSLEMEFAVFRDQIIGREQTFVSPYGTQKILYADWTASGRAYQPIETYLQGHILPIAANTHTGSTETSSVISKAYEEAKTVIKSHVHAGKDDVLLFCGSGMTAAVNKLQRLLGLRIPERLKEFLQIPEIDESRRPVVFVTHMEHHSNHTSWLETIATVEIIQPDVHGNMDLDHLRQLLQEYAHRPLKIAAVTACSNVTGIETPYPEIAKIIHEHGGLCFLDFACSAPYVDIDMKYLDAIYFSAHKFLGGPGTPGILIFNQKLYTNKIPDQPGGGTVTYSNPWGGYDYVADIETREDGGTPPYLQGIKAALCVRVKDAMGTDRMLGREKELLAIIFARFKSINNATILQGQVTGRLGIVSFMIEGAHHNLVVKLLNDRFGIQARGGCSCAGTYGHYLLNVDSSTSKKIQRDIQASHLENKPGWVRLSVHPTMTDAEIHFIMDAIQQIALGHHACAADYQRCHTTSEFLHRFDEVAVGVTFPIF